MENSAGWQRTQHVNDDGKCRGHTILEPQIRLSSLVLSPETVPEVSCVAVMCYRTALDSNGNKHRQREVAGQKHRVLPTLEIIWPLPGQGP